MYGGVSVSVSVSRPWDGLGIAEGTRAIPDTKSRFLWPSGVRPPCPESNKGEHESIFPTSTCASLGFPSFPPSQKKQKKQKKQQLLAFRACTCGSTLPTRNINGSTVLYLACTWPGSCPSASSVHRFTFLTVFLLGLLRRTFYCVITGFTRRTTTDNRYSVYTNYLVLRRGELPT